MQVNGKLRGTVALPRDCPQDEAEAAALALDAVARSLTRRPNASSWCPTDCECGA